MVPQADSRLWLRLRTSELDMHSRSGCGSAGWLGGQDGAQTWERRGGFQVWTVDIECFCRVVG